MLKIIQKNIDSCFGDVYSKPELVMSFTMFKKHLIADLEQQYLQWEATVRNEYKNYRPPVRRKKRKNLDGTPITDIFGRFKEEHL